MRLRLLLGRAGAGRTRRCLEEIRAEQERCPLGPPLLLIVPDQATFTAELELASLGGGVRAQVFSFRRLAQRVLQEAGGGGVILLSDLGRRMMLKSILLAEKEKLPQLGRLHSRPGFLASLAELVAELKVHLFSPRDLLALAAHASLGENLAQKLKEIALVYGRLEEKTAGSTADPEGLLSLLLQRLPRAASWLRGCRVWVDGFATFNPLEYAVLKALLPFTEEMTVSLCLDPENLAERPADYSPFAKPWQTRERFLRLAARLPGEFKEEHLPPPAERRFKNAPELAYLESSFFRYTAPPYPGPVERIRLVAAVNPRAEAAAIGRTIRRLLREGFRPGQIMVAVRSIDVYFPLLRRVLRDYEIPFFLDHRQPVAHHPLVEMLRAALEVLRTGWAYEPVFRYLKTGLAPLSRQETDLLENYVLAAGIRGHSWVSPAPWRYRPGVLWTENKPEVDQEFSASPENSAAPDDRHDLEEINRLRRRAAAELLRLQKDIAAASGDQHPARLPGRAWARLLTGLALALNVPQKLAYWSSAALAAGDPDLARQHRQVWQAVTEVLDQLATALGETPLPLPELSSVLEAAWEELSLGLIPPRLEAVVVGSLERSRPPRDLQVLFLPGLNEGVLPAGIRTYGVLSEAEKEQLAELAAGLEKELPPAADHRWQLEQFTVYTALSRTGGRLWLSYPLGDSEGKALLPSPVVRRVQELLPQLKVEFLPGEPPGGGLPDGAADAEWLEHPAGLLPHLTRRWREALAGSKIYPGWWRLYNLLLTDRKWRAKLQYARDGLFQRNQEQPLGEELGLLLWGRPRGPKILVPASVSRLESFARCPFAFFLNYGLKLKPRLEYEFSPPAAGHLYHEALRRFVEEVEAAEIPWDQLPENKIEQICGAVVDELAERLQGSILLTSGRLRRQKEHLRERISHSARAMARHFGQSKFLPVATEVPFGTAAAEPGGPVAENRQDAGTEPGAKRPAGLPACWGRLALPPREVLLGKAGGKEVSLVLGGRIDRLDAAQEGNCLFVRVVDYKTAPLDLRLADVLAGLQLQLLFYLAAAEAGLQALLRAKGCALEVLAGGAFYFPVQRPLLPKNIADPAELDREWLKTFKLKGWLFDHSPASPAYFRMLDVSLEPGRSSLLVPLSLNREGAVNRTFSSRVFSPAEWAALRRELEALAARMGRDMAAGRVDIAPVQAGRSLACASCDFRQVCRFDPLLPENRPRPVRAGSRELRQLLAAQATGEEETVLVPAKLDR